MSNNLVEGVATGGDTPPEPYSRSLASSQASGSSTKRTLTERKASKGAHFEKVAATIGDVIQKSLGSLQPEQSASSELATARTQAYLSRENEQTLEVKLKRQRETIEAPSFQELSPELQRQPKRSYAMTLRECNNIFS